MEVKRHTIYPPSYREIEQTLRTANLPATPEILTAVFQEIVSTGNPNILEVARLLKESDTDNKR